MQRVLTPTAVPEKPAYGITGVPGYFRSGDPVQGIPATVAGQDWFNRVQEELVYLILQAGIELDPSDDTQLYQAILEFLALHNASAESHADIRALIAAIDPDSLLATPNTWAKSQRYEPYALSIVSGAVAWDVQAHPVATLTLTANVTSLTLSNVQAGATYELTILQDATGGRTMSWPASWRWPEGSALAVSSAAAAEDLIHLSTRDVSGTVIIRATAAQALAVAS